MAIYRNIHISFWEDSKVQEEMSINEKYFFLYLLTNPHTSQIGCYEITIRQMQYETGLDRDEIEKYLEKFEKEFGIIEYSKMTKELLIKNWYKYNFTRSPKMFAYIKKEIQNIKHVPYKNYLDTVCIPYVYGIAIRKEQEEEQEKEEEEKKKKWEEQFEQFYKSYPKKVKKDLVKKWFEKNKPSSELFSSMMNSLEQFRGCEDWLKDKGQYIPYPSTWLNQKRWEDENINTPTQKTDIKNTYQSNDSQYSNLDKFIL